MKFYKTILDIPEEEYLETLLNEPEDWDEDEYDEEE